MDESTTGVTSISPPPSSYTQDTTLAGSVVNNDWDEANSTLARYIEKKRRKSSSDIRDGVAGVAGAHGNDYLIPDSIKNNKNRASKDNAGGNNSLINFDQTPSRSLNSQFSQRSNSRSSLFGFNCIKQACWFFFSWVLFIFALLVNYFGTTSFWSDKYVISTQLLYMILFVIFILFLLILSLL